MTPARTIKALEVAQLLGCTETTFRSKRRKLEAEHGFPPKLPGCNGWSLPAVERWIATNGNTYLPGSPEDVAVGTDPHFIEIISDAADRLASEFGRSAA